MNDLNTHDVEPQGQSWQEIIAPLFRRRKLIVTTVVVGVSTAAILAWLTPPQYTATAAILVEAKRTEVAVSPDENTRSFVSNVGEGAINAQAVLLSSPSLTREVLSRHLPEAESLSSDKFSLRSLVTLPLRLPGILYNRLHNMPEPSLLDQWTQATLDRIEVYAVPRSNLITVRFSDPDPQWAAMFVNELLQLHIDRSAEMSEQSTAMRFYRQQGQLLLTKLDRARRQLQEFRQRAGGDLALLDEDELRARIGDLQLSRMNTKAALAEAEARGKFLRKELENLPSVTGQPASVGFEALQALQQRILELRIQRTELLSRYAPTSTRVRELDEQIAKLEHMMDSEQPVAGESVALANPAYQQLESQIVNTRAEIAAGKARLQALNEQIEAYAQKLSALERVSSEKDRLENEVATLRRAYNTYMQKEEAARFSDALDESRIVNVSIAELATVPTIPDPSKRGIALILGFGFSLCAGIALAFIRDRLDPAIKSRAHAERVAEAPVLAEIPS
ncbi:MAG: hypothetical protein D6815_03785 [Candidatus Dadabacteria bacterium]|nr:MAG: hypothetical protein D6815_03785 [Candidatus Dadabacteria bacterium]